MPKPAGRPKTHEDNAEKQRAYRERVQGERWALANELERLRRQLQGEDRQEAAELLSRVQSALQHGRPSKTDPARAGQQVATPKRHDTSPRAGHPVSLHEAVTVAACLDPQPISVQVVPISADDPETLMPRQLEPGEVPPIQPHHSGLIAELSAGGSLVEVGSNLWQLISNSSKGRKVDARTVATLLSKGMLKVKAD